MLCSFSIPLTLITTEAYERYSDFNEDDELNWWLWAIDVNVYDLSVTFILKFDLIFSLWAL